MLDRAVAVLVVALGAIACSSTHIEPSDAGGDTPTDGPYLTALSVTRSGDLETADGGTLPPIEIVPAFSPDVFDYYVRCSQGSNTVVVSLTPSAGASGSLRLPMPSLSSEQPQTLPLNVSENQAIVATAAAGTLRTEYWVRCLPYDFPVLQMTPVADAGAPPPGYYLVGTSLPRPGSRWGYALVLNGNGVPVWYVQGPAAQGVENIDTQLPEAVSFVPTLGFLPFEMHHLSPPKTTYSEPDGGYEIDTHELRVLGNGDYLVISSPTKTGVDLTGINLRLPDGGVQRFGKGSNMIDCHIVEFEPATGKVVWDWVASDHFDPVVDSTIPTNNGRAGPDGGAVVDIFHCNSIDVDPANGNLLISAREMDSVFYIERSTGKVLWKLGGSSFTKDHATYLSAKDPFYRQHDGRLQPGWSATTCGGKGQISVYDDHSYVKGPARGVVYDVVVGDGDGGGCGTLEAGATVAWQYDGPGNSNDRGSFRISADGSRIIGWGTLSQRGLVFTEVDDAGHPLLSFHYADGDVSYRAIKVPLTAFDLSVLRSTAGQTY
jgi:hypothetical protein